MANKKLKNILKKRKDKTVYGIGKELGISPQAADYIVNRKDLEKDYIRLQKIATYLEVSIEDILDLKK